MNENETAKSKRIHNFDSVDPVVLLFLDEPWFYQRCVGKLESVPSDFGVVTDMIKLFPHQEAALKSTEGKPNVAFFHDMGTGKTFTGSEKMMSYGNRANLVVCQKSKIQDWVDHFTEHYDKKVFDLTQPAQLSKFMGLAMGDRFTVIGVINYDLLFRRKELLNLRKFTLMLDESSLICNAKTKRTKFILLMHPKNVILLSGTPSGGKYENLWTQIHLLGWRISEKVYNAQYVNWKSIEVGGFIHKVVDKSNPYKNVERLKQKMRDYGCDFLKTEEVFDLPEQNFIEVNVPITKEYKQFKKDHLVTVDGIEFVGDSTLSFRLYQRELCSAYNPNKVQAFRDLLESTQDRLIVFYNFNCELVELQAACNDLDRPYSMVNGSVKDLTAYEQESNSVTLVQYQAGAKGLNLQKANKMIYFSLPESVDNWMQSIKRIHRIGQTVPCFYYLLICKDSIEEKIKYCLDRGVDFNDQLFDE